MTDNEAFAFAKEVLEGRQSKPGPHSPYWADSTNAIARCLEIARGVGGFRPTHMHTESFRSYMVVSILGPILNVETDVAVEMVLYRDEDGKTFTQSRARFDEILASGKPRFEALK